MTFVEARALDNRPASGLGSTMEIIRESSGINWIWLRILFKGTSFPPLDIIGDHSEGSGGEGSVWWGLDGWRQLLVFVPLLTWRKRMCHSNSYSTLKVVHSKYRVMASAVRALPSRQYIPFDQKLWSRDKKWKNQMEIHGLKSTFINQSDKKLLISALYVTVWLPCSLEESHRFFIIIKKYCSVLYLAVWSGESVINYNKQFQTNKS